MNYLRVLMILLAAAMLQAAEDLDVLLEEANVHVESERLNVDYTPSVISVLKHDEMSVLGIKTLFEALSIMPGVETSISQFGVKKVIVRGFDNPNNFTFDKTRLLIDGVLIETAFLSNTSTFLEMPVDIIERIELLRGPASAFYGSGAFNGVINVITRHRASNGSAVFFGGGSYGYRMGGGRVFEPIGPATSLQADVYLQRSDKQLKTDESFAMTNLYDLQLGPVDFPRDLETNEQLDDYSIGLTFRHKGFSLKTRYKERKSGNYYGWNERLEMRTDLRNTEKYYFVEGAYDAPVASGTNLLTILHYSCYQLDLDAQDYYKTSGVQIPYIFSLQSMEDKYRAESRIVSTAYDGHFIEAGGLWQSIRDRGNEISDPISPYGARPMVREGLRRDNVALYARDTWEVSEAISVLIALRGDYYTDEYEFYPSAQLGALYTLNDTMQFKFNYGHAFRVPSWVERYTIEYGPDDGTRFGDPDLKAETTDTFELVAILKPYLRQRLQLNTYYALQHDVLDIDDREANDGYRNYPGRISAGAEAAYDLMLLTQDHLNMNLSYTHTTYETAGSGIKQQMPTAAMWMAKGYYVHYFDPRLSLSLLGKYIGTRPRNQEFDESHADNADLDPYFTLDTTLAYNDVSGWNLAFSVKNLLDADVRYPSYYNHHEAGLQREGRNYLVQAEYRF